MKYWIYFAVLLCSVVSLVAQDNVTTEKNNDAVKEMQKEEVPKGATKLVSNDGQMQLYLYGGMKHTQLDPRAPLQAANLFQELYIMVLELPKQQTLKEFNTALLSRFPGAKVTNTAAVKIDGLNGIQTEFDVSANGQNISFIITNLEGKSHFYYIAAWTLKSKYALNRATLLNVSGSFKMLKAAKKVEGRIATADKKFSILLPKGMQSTTVLHEDATLQGVNSKDELYLLLFDEAKTIFGGSGLEGYLDIVRNQMKGRFADAKITDPVSLKIGGHKALEIEISGTIDDIDVTYLLTVIETKEHYHQVIMWSESKRFEEHKQVMQVTTRSFQAE